jgi:hypothetical protein
MVAEQSGPMSARFLNGMQKELEMPLIGGCDESINRSFS